MTRIRIMASRKAWLLHSRNRNQRAKARYDALMAYECRRNGTETYTPYWMAA